MTLQLLKRSKHFRKGKKAENITQLHWIRAKITPKWYGVSYLYVLSFAQYLFYQLRNWENWAVRLTKQERWSWLTWFCKRCISHVCTHAINEYTLIYKVQKSTKLHAQVHCTGPPNIFQCVICYNLWFFCRAWSSCRLCIIRKQALAKAVNTISS